MFVSCSEPTAKQLRWFGASLALVVTTVGLIAWLRWGQATIGMAAVAVAVVFSVIYYAVPSLQRTLFAFSRSVSYPLSLVVGVVLLSVVFYAVILPIAVVVKLSGRDPIAKQPDRSARTYWQPSSVKPSMSRYFRMY